MSIFGNAIVSADITQSNIVAAFCDWTADQSSSPSKVGLDSAGVGAVAMYNGAFFSHENGVLTCKKDGAYNITYFAKGNYGSNGVFNCAFDLLVNGQTSIASSSGVANGGAINSVLSYGLSVGDTLQMNFGRTSSGTLPVKAGFYITV